MVIVNLFIITIYYHLVKIIINSQKLTEIIVVQYYNLFNLITINKGLLFILKF